ncbi:hypothetical protein D3C78_617980 [compost metagenome]
MRRVFHGVQVIEVAKELVEAMYRGQELVAVAQVVLAELAGGIAHGLERGGDGDGFGGNADGRAGLADRGHAGTDRQFAGDEVGAPGGATGFGVVVGKAHAFGRKGIEVGCSAGHHALVVDADVRPADIVAHDHDNVGGRVIGGMESEGEGQCGNQYRRGQGRGLSCAVHDEFPCLSVGTLGRTPGRR